ncbi:MAG: FHA domain-containing protein [Spirochaetales bacterium]|nr:FHA domain-containing protein [Spirochaetales bacterium]
MPAKKTQKNISRVKTVVNKDPHQPGAAGILKRRGVLVILSENKFGKSFVLKKPEIILGRSDKCTIKIEDELLSREHCRITNESEMFYIEDLSPTNPSFVNSKKVKKKMMIHYADRIVAGGTIFRFFLEEELE